MGNGQWAMGNRQSRFRDNCPLPADDCLVPTHDMEVNT